MSARQNPHERRLEVTEAAAFRLPMGRSGSFSPAISSTPARTGTGMQGSGAAVGRRPSAHALQRFPKVIRARYPASRTVKDDGGLRVPLPGLRAPIRGAPAHDCWPGRHRAGVSFVQERPGASAVLVLRGDRKCTWHRDRRAGRWRLLWRWRLWLQQLTSPRPVLPALARERNAFTGRRPPDRPTRRRGIPCP